MARTTDWRTLDTIVERLNAANIPYSQVDATLNDKNEQLALYGVESLSFSCSVYPSVLYVNAGAPYVATICYDINAAEFVSAGWGDILEYHEYTCSFCLERDE